MFISGRVQLQNRAMNNSLSSFGKARPPFKQAHVDHVAKGFDEEYAECFENGVHERFDELDREKNYAQMYNMLEDENVTDFLLWHMEMKTVTLAPFNIVQTDEFHIKGYGSGILAVEE
jgi:hypothetical protein